MKPKFGICHNIRCRNKISARNLCDSHYKELMEGTSRPKRPSMHDGPFFPAVESMTCATEGCRNFKRYARKDGMCSTHRSQGRAKAA